MKKIKYVKFALDILMVVVFTLLFNKRVLGMQFHEVAGLIIGGVVLVHCGLNWKWIKGVTLKLFTSKIPIKTKIGYIIDVLLLINVAVIIITGIFISKTLFAGLGLGGAPSLKFLHISASYFSLMLIGIHLGLHWNWVISIFKKTFKIPEKKIYTYLSKVMVILVLAFGIYSANSVDYLSKISFNAASGVENKIKKEIKSGLEVDNLNQTEDKSSERPHKAREGEGVNVSILSVIMTYLGVISVFSIVTFYIKKLLNMKKNSLDAITTKA